jgi:phage terminase large subunit GpA-like protein
MTVVDFDGAQELRAAWLAGLAPDPRQTVSEWADRHRILSSRAASEAGPYRTSRTPYLREIMDALSPSSPLQRIVFMKAAQVGATEAGNNWIGYVMHRAPGPFLAVQPTTELAKRLSQQRIEPLIEESPVLRALVAPARSRDSGNTILAKRFPGGQFVLTGANSAVGLRSMPARWVFLDEIDAYPGDVDGEGDPVALAEARTVSFGHRAKMFLVSTPTIRGLSRIEREFALSDQRRYHVPCPHCGTLQWLKFERLRWPKGLPDRVRYFCEACEEPIEERHKTAFMDPANGARWLPTAPPEQQEAARAAGSAGFHISALYSPLGWQTWEEIARLWEAAQGNDAALKTVKNTVLGETWAERGEAPDWERLYERRGPHRLGEVAEGVMVLTAGADVQRDRVEIDVWGWGRGLRSWLVDHIVIQGEIGTDAVRQALSDLLLRTWRHPSGSELPISRLAIDTGDGATTDAVYAWVRAQSRDRVMAIKGMRDGIVTSPVDGPTWVEVTERGRKVRRGVQLWSVKVGYFKAETYRFLRLAAPTDEDLEAGRGWPSGFVHIPRGVTSEWVRQLTAEQLVTVKTRTGHAKTEWQKLRERNEALDCRVYARAAAWLLGLDRWDEPRWEQRALALEPVPARPGEEASPVPRQLPPDLRGEDAFAAVPKREQTWLGPRRRGWL